MGEVRNSHFVVARAAGGLRWRRSWTEMVWDMRGRRLEVWSKVIEGVLPSVVPLKK